jgi:hypothetical protein
MSSPLLTKTIEDKRYLWLEGTNQYVVLEHEAFTVVEKLIKGVLPKTIATDLAIGDAYQGGVIFYMNGSGGGLIAAVADQSSGIRWYNGSYIDTGATGTAIGTGSANTDAIITAQGATQTDYAAGLARAYTGGGYTDWFLPSKDALNKMYLEKSTINITASENSGSDFSESWYWSSTKNASNSAHCQVFDTGAQTGNTKTFITQNVRAVRAF